MEDLAFNKNANMVKNGQGGYIFKAIRLSMFSWVLFQRLVWVAPLVKRAPILNRDYLKFWDWIQNQIDERCKVGRSYSKLLEAG